MKYEAPICENVRIDNVDIICTSGWGWSDNTTAGDTPMVPISDLNQEIN